MRRALTIAAFMCAILAGRPAPALADLTGFLGVTTTPDSRSTKGVAIGISLLVVGFEFEFAKTAQEEATGSPGLTTGMGNLMVMTPTSRLQLYGTTGGGLFHETYREIGNTNFGTNVGGGVKLSLAGPIRLRIDYRVFNFNGNPLYKHVHRVYGGLSLSF